MSRRARSNLATAPPRLAVGPDHLDHDLPFPTEVPGKARAVAAGSPTMANDADTPMTFGDLGAVLHYVRPVPWTVDGFDPVKDRDALDRIHAMILDEGRLIVRDPHIGLCTQDTGRVEEPIDTLEGGEDPGQPLAQIT